MAMDTTNNIHMDIRQGRDIHKDRKHGRDGKGDGVCLFACVIVPVRFLFVLSWVASCIITNQNQPHHTKVGKRGETPTDREKHTPRNTLASRLQFQLTAAFKIRSCPHRTPISIRESNFFFFFFFLMGGLAVYERAAYAFFFFWEPRVAMVGDFCWVAFCNCFIYVFDISLSSYPAGAEQNGTEQTEAEQSRAEQSRAAMDEQLTNLVGARMSASRLRKETFCVTRSIIF